MTCLGAPIYKTTCKVAVPIVARVPWRRCNLGLVFHFGIHLRSFSAPSSPLFPICLAATELCLLHFSIWQKGGDGRVQARAAAPTGSRVEGRRRPGTGLAPSATHSHGARAGADLTPKSGLGGVIHLPSIYWLMSSSSTDTPEGIARRRRCGRSCYWVR